VIVIKHNLDVIKTADWVVDLGPDGGDGGGRIVVAGTPEQVALHDASHTGRYLQTALQRAKCDPAAPSAQRRRASAA
jgi:excinuclease ABC subunit A